MEFGANPAVGPVPMTGAPVRLPRRRRAPTESSDASFRAIVGQVGWTMSYVCLLLYVFAIVTYRLPIGSLAMVGALLGLFLQRGPIRFPPLIVSFGVFLLWGVVGYMESPFQAAVSERLNLLFKLWLIALVVVNTLRTWDQYRFFLIFFLFCFATHPARGAIFNYFYGYTLVGRAVWNHIFENPNDLAALTLLPLSVAAMLLRDRSKWVRLGAKASVIVLPIVILMTQSRGVFIALALFAALTLFGQRRKLRQFVLLGLVATVVVMIAPDGVWERVRGVPDAVETDSSARQRRQIWRIAAEIHRDYPVMGVGLGAYRYVHAEYASRKAEHMIAQGTRDTHSTYLNTLVDAGYPGLLVFLTMIAVPMVGAERMRRKARHALPERAVQLWYLEVGLLAFLAAGIFGTYGHLTFLYIHLAMLVVFTEIVRREFAQAAGVRRPSIRRHRRGWPAVPARGHA